METVKEIPVGDSGKTKPVLRLPFAGIENAYIIVSFRAQRVSLAHLDLYIKYREPFCLTEPALSFFYAGAEQGAEWMPGDGPIMVYRKCTPDWEGESPFGTKLKAKKHWFYDYVEDNALAWSQLAVDQERLKEKLSKGDFKGIFRSLRLWALESE